MISVRSHRGIAFLLALAAPALIAFCWHDVISTLDDDSVSYITLARWMLPFGHDPIVAPWVGYYSHFPPVFPALLALTGGAWNLLAAHLLVAACALSALAMVYAYGASRLGGARNALGLSIVFLLMPTAWIGALSILSEPLYLALSLAALVVHARHEEDAEARPVALGLLFTAAYLTRVAGIALLAAYAVHLAVRSRQRRTAPSMRALAVLLVPVAIQFLWFAVRPAVVSKGYQTDVGIILAAWIADPASVASLSWKHLSGGWIASFSADSGEPLSMRALFLAVAVLGLAGAVRGAMRNRVDSWYLLLGTAMLGFWVFEEDNQRRLLYPLVPLVLVHAGELLLAAGKRLGARPYLPLLMGGCVVAVASLPATLLVVRKATEREPFYEGYGYSPAAMLPYYTTVNLKEARFGAQQRAAILAGLQMLQLATPPDAKVMWTRPEYIAILGRREAVPWYFSWNRETLAREIQRTGTTHVIAARLFKIDLAGKAGDAYAAFAVDTPDYLHLALSIPDPETGTPEFALLAVDPEALKRTIAAFPPKR